MLKTFSEVLKIVNGRNQKAVESENGLYPIYGSGGIMGYAYQFLCPGNTVILGRKGNINAPLFSKVPFWNVDTAFGLVPDQTALLPEYLYYFCVNYNFNKLNTTVTIPSLTKANLLKVRIDLPDLDTQRSRIKKISLVDKLIESSQQLLIMLDKMVKSRFIEMFENKYQLSSIEDLCIEIVDCPHSTPKYDEETLEYPAIRTSEIKDGSIDWSSMKYVGKSEYEKRTKKLAPIAGDIVYAREGTYGDCVILPAGSQFCLGQRTMLFRADQEKCISAYLYSALRSDSVKKQADKSNSGSTVPHVNVKDAKKFKIPLPPLDEQKEFQSFFESINKSKLAIQKSIDELEVLKKSLMQEYFG